MKDSAYNSQVDTFIKKEVKRRLRDEYMGCCLAHVTYGARVIAILGTLFDACIVILMVIKITKPKISGDPLLEDIGDIQMTPLSALDIATTCIVGILATFGMIFHALVFYGIEKEKSSPFVPYLMIKSFEIACLGATFFGELTKLTKPIFLISGIGSGGDDYKQQILLACTILTKIWFWSIIRMAYSYYKKKEELNKYEACMSIDI